MLDLRSGRLLLIFLLLSSCAPSDGSPPRPRFNNDALTTALKPGLSTAQDVKEALGSPSGAGQFLFPGDREPRLVWFYQKVEATVSSRHVGVQQDVLMVFLRNDRFDGYLWYSDAVKKW